MYAFMTVKNLIKKCKTLATEYSNKVNTFDSRVTWSIKQPGFVSEYDCQLLEMLDEEAKKTRRELDTNLLILETQLPRD